MFSLTRVTLRVLAVCVKNRASALLPSRSRRSCHWPGVPWIVGRSPKKEVLYWTPLAAISYMSVKNSGSAAIKGEAVASEALEDHTGTSDSVDGGVASVQQIVDVSGQSDSKKDIGNKKDKMKKVKKRKSKSPGLHATFKRPRLTSDDEMSKTTHYFEDGLRKIVPYDHQYNTFCKGRWVGKTLGELYTNEFRLYPIEFYERLVKEKKMLVNLKPAESLDRIVKDNDLLTSVAHRHECPVSAAPVTVIAETEEFFVVNKPCSIPLHPVGRFRYNSLLSILAKDFGKKNLFSLHRLDRMTSGLTVFAKTKERAAHCYRHIKERTVQKEYVCRVVGDFTKFCLPENHEHLIKVNEDEVTVSEPMKVFDMKVGTSIVSRSEDAKDCVTTFKCLSTDGKTSVVRCMPKTGRTHQIRVHLQYLGFPITNDPLYNSPAWGDERFLLGPITKSLDVIMDELSIMKKWLSVVDSFNKSVENEKNISETSGQCNTSKNLAEPAKAPDMSAALVEAIGKVEGIVPYRSDCEECKQPLPDPKPHEIIMYLHALKYKGPDWEFETPLPEWASPDWVDSQCD